MSASNVQVKTPSQSGISGRISGDSSGSLYLASNQVNTHTHTHNPFSRGTTISDLSPVFSKTNPQQVGATQKDQAKKTRRQVFKTRERKEKDHGNGNGVKKKIYLERHSLVHHSTGNKMATTLLNGVQTWKNKSPRI